MRNRVIVLIVGLVLGAVAVARADRPESVVPRTKFVAFPMQFGAWKGIQEPPFEKAVLDVLGVDDYLTRTYYTDDKMAVGLYIGFWGSQRQGDTIHSPANCLPGSGWEPVSRTVINLPGATGPAPINRYVIQKGIDKQLVLYWYQSHGRILASEYWGKFYLISDAMRFNRTDGALVRIIAPVRGGTPEAERLAEAAAMRFAADLAPQLTPYLPH